MCGIVGAIATHDVSEILLKGLEKLEYRGYDSSGIVLIDKEQQFQRVRTAGKIALLEKKFRENPVKGNIGIAHTRWATHGEPNEINAHPHIANNDIAIVHNGIIENHAEIRAELIKKGCVITSSTDTELIAHLIVLHLKKNNDFLSAVKKTTKELAGTFALGIIRRSEPQHLITVCYGSSLVIGLGENENYIASDPLALLHLTKRFIYLGEGDLADVSKDKVTIYDKDHSKIKRPIVVSTLDPNNISKGNFPHFMLKEIFEQPDAVTSTLEGRLSGNQVFVEAFGTNAKDIFKKTKHVHMVACGTSYHACLVTKNWLEQIARIQSQVFIASEYRNLAPIVDENTLFITVSQSGETADTIAALKLAKKLNYLATLSICNVPDSSLVRHSDLVLSTHAGPEISVASTKAFTTQLTALLLFTTAMQEVNLPNEELTSHLVKQLKMIPLKIQECLTLNNAIPPIAKHLLKQPYLLFIARGIEFPITLEGALKFREITYIPAEAYPAGELKHGTIAIIYPGMLIIALAPHDEMLAKLKSNLQEILARKGKLILFTEKNSDLKDLTEKDLLFNLPDVDPIIAPIIYTIPLHLLAYHVAVLKGNDVDQPRNLAKSVTVD